MCGVGLARGARRSGSTKATGYGMTSIFAEVLHLGFTYVQFNMGALASFELVARRLAAIVEHVNSGVGQLVGGPVFHQPQGPK